MPEDRLPRSKPSLVLFFLSILGLQCVWFLVARYAQTAANSHLGFGHPRGLGLGLVLLLDLAVVVFLLARALGTKSRPSRLACAAGALTTAGWCMHLLTIGCESCRAGG
ncbi:MAG: hypothetical protein ACRBN8_24805 [Nannocystales bacterium]